MKIGPVGAELFHANGRTDRETDVTKLIDALGSLSRAPNIRAAASIGISRLIELKQNIELSNYYITSVLFKQYVRTQKHILPSETQINSRPVFLKCRAATKYRALASIIPDR